MALPMVSEVLWRMRAVCSDMVGLEAVKAPTYQICGDRPSRSWRWSFRCMLVICIYWLPAHLKELGGLVSISHECN
jgi:hypothetical protein